MVKKFSKTTVYKLPYYHYSEGPPMEALHDWIETLKELLPECNVDYESSKIDKGYITITKIEK